MSQSQVVLVSEHGVRKAPQSVIPDPELDAVRDEVFRQLAKWGVQDHPIVSPKVREHAKAVEVDASCIVGLPSEAGVKSAVDMRARDKTLDYTLILLEEFVEAVNADNDDDAYNELIQLAAVAVSAANSIRRKNSTTIRLGTDGTIVGMNLRAPSDQHTFHS